MLTIGIFLTNGMTQVTDVLARSPQLNVVPFSDLQALQAALPNLDAAILQNASYTPAIASAVAASPRLKWLQSAATGVDAFRRNGVPLNVLLTNAGDIWADSVAEHAMALLLALTRALPAVQRLRDERRWDRDRIAPLVRSLSGRKMLVVGFGNIGRSVARRARAFDMEVIGISRSRTGDIAPANRIATPDRLHAVLPEADVVVLSLPPSSETTGLFGAGEFALMKSSSLFLNVSRGEIVVQDALVTALREHRLAGAGLDVTDPEPLPADSPLWSFDNVIVSPHVAGLDDGRSFQKLGELCLENAERMLAGQALPNPISS